MSILQTKIEMLGQSTSELMNIGVGDTPVYADRFVLLNDYVYRQAENLFRKRTLSDEDEAAVCISLLKAYNATIYDHGDKAEKIRLVLLRSWVVLDKLPDSPLKCRLLIACYAETYDESLARESCDIMDKWSGSSLKMERLELQNELRLIKENQYPYIIES